MESELAAEEQLLEKNRLIQKGIQELITQDFKTEAEKRKELYMDLLNTQAQVIRNGSLSSAQTAVGDASTVNNASTDNSTVNNVTINVEG